MGYTYICKEGETPQDDIGNLPDGFINCLCSLITAYLFGLYSVFAFGYIPEFQIYNQVQKHLKKIFLWRFFRYEKHNF